MTCKNCGKKIVRMGFDWVHVEPPNRYRCTDKPEPDPQRYAEPKVGIE